MQTNLLLLILVAATLLVLIYLVFRVKAVLYLLQQPVVKKMSPQLRLKPVKLDDAMNRNAGNRDGREGRGERRDENRGERRDGDRNRGEGRGERREGGRPEGRRDENRGEGRGERRDENRGERREGRPEGRRDENRGEGRGERRDENRGERREGGRPEGRRDENRGEGREARGERRDGDRNRGEGRGERRDENRGERRPPREFSETRDFAPAVASEAAPASEPALSPRRPLASFDAPASESVETSAPAPSASETFVGSSDDMQHGRRTQLKKKPRFDIEEDESTAA